MAQDRARCESIKKLSMISRALSVYKNSCLNTIFFRAASACLLLSFFPSRLFAEDYKWDYSQMPTNEVPKNCFSIVAGQGQPGTWKVITDEFPLPFAPISSTARATAPKSVVGQTSREATDEHFPMLQLGTNSYGDFKFSTQFKLVDGVIEQMAGVAFRIQDPQNFYYVRASGLGNTFYFYCVRKGERQNPIGNAATFAKGVWHELGVECSGAKIIITLDGKQAIPTLNDFTFSSGKIALLTKSDAVSYFTDTKINYTPKIPFIRQVVQDTAKEHPGLVGLQVMKVDPTTKKSRIVASKKESEIGMEGESSDADCVADGTNYFRSEGKLVYVTMPLRDRNGEVLGVARFVMKPFNPLNAKENAVASAAPILQQMQTRLATVDSLD
jgi:hypothetical protein